MMFVYTTAIVAKIRGDIRRRRAQIDVIDRRIAATRKETEQLQAEIAELNERLMDVAAERARQRAQMEAEIERRVAALLAAPVDKTQGVQSEPYRKPKRHTK